MEESNKSELKAELIYGLNDRPPLRETLFAALQHLLAIFVAIITPPLIIAGALKLDIETTSFLVSMALFASGVSTFIQCRRIGGIGTGLYKWLLSICTVRPVTSPLLVHRFL